MSRKHPTVHDLAVGVRAGDRALLARAITLVESTRTSDAAMAQRLVEDLLPDSGQALRIGISGVPGVGKSTFIEALGAHLTAGGRRVAVLAVDPSSQVTGGSILGDKTRMSRLSRDVSAFIRPSPGGSTLGGVARRTREAMVLCEAAGYDVVLIETIGVGQSEVAVAGMVDVFLLLALAGAGDDLQGIKRGITEIADLVVITKADGDNVEPARRAAAHMSAALALVPGPEHGDPDTPRTVLTCSARDGTGIDDVWCELARIHTEANVTGRLDLRRRSQALSWLDHAVAEMLGESFAHHPDVVASKPRVRDAVLRGVIDPTAGARHLVDIFLDRSRRDD